MGPYLVLLGIICIEGFLILNLKNLKNKDKYFLILVAIEMIVFTGLRSINIGSDTTAYVYIVELFENISFKDIWNGEDNPYGFEIGYLIFSKFCSFLGLTGTKFLFVVASVIYIPFFVFIYKDSKSPLISVIVYFTFSLFYYSLGIFRQMIALSICLCAIPSLKDKKTIKYHIIILVATLFHTTAICWIPLYWLSIINVNLYKRAVIPISLMAVPLGTIIVQVVLSIVPKYAHYLGTERAVGGGTYFMLVLLIITYAMIDKKTSQEGLSRNDEIVIAGISLAIFMQAVAYSFGLLGRAVCYYSIFEAILIPEIISVWFKGELKIIMKCITIAILILLTIVTQFYGNKYICPFTFIWEC